MEYHCNKMKILFISHSPRVEISWKYTNSHMIHSKNFKAKGHDVVYVPKEDWVKITFMIRNYRPDVVITLGAIGGIVAWLKRLHLVKIPKLIYYWADNYEEIMGEAHGKRLIRFLEKSAVKHSDKVISISKYRVERGIKEFKKTKGEDIFYLEQGYNKEFLANAKQIQLFGKNKTKVVYCGGLTKSKGFPHIEDTLKEIKNVDFIIIGDDVDRKHPEDKKNIFHLGWKDRKDIYSYLISADFLLVTEDNDSSLKLFEYQVLGKPVLTPRGKISKYLNLKNCLFYNDFSEIKELIKTNKKFQPQKIKTWEELSNEMLEMINK